MCRTNDGFQISQADLQLRGPGDMSGTAQSGVLNLRIADIVKDERLLYQVRQITQNIVEQDPFLELNQHIILRKFFFEKHKISDFSMIS